MNGDKLEQTLPSCSKIHFCLAFLRESLSFLKNKNKSLTLDQVNKTKREDFLFPILSKVSQDSLEWKVESKDICRRQLLLL